MKARGNCPDCKLRDVSTIVRVPGRPEVRLCAHCASAYDASEVERLQP